ncbi:MAG: vWA domain-containing protein [Bdellovibrionota bacterium]|jgi:Ca-activated chloride channel family protein
MFRFESPYYLLLLPLIVLLLLFLRKRKRPAIIYSSTSTFRALPKSFKQRILWLPTLLRLSTLLCLIIALARPQMGLETVRRSTSGIAIEVVLDRSGSMQEQILYDGKAATRLNVVKDVFKEFALGSAKSGLAGRKDDLIGIITFARHAKTVCPLTLAHGAIEHILKTITLAKSREEDGTAIGDAIALAAARLQKAEESIEAQGGDTEYKIKSKIIILLTDGQNNVGTITPLAAAELAAKWGIKIYTIGIGGNLQTRQGGFFDSFLIPFGTNVDTRSLQSIAEKTGGAFYMAEDAQSLRKIYKDIDRLEKTEFKATHDIKYRELFVPWAFTALLLLLFEVLLTNTYLRRVP